MRQGEHHGLDEGEMAEITYKSGYIAARFLQELMRREIPSAEVPSAIEHFLSNVPDLLKRLEGPSAAGHRAGAFRSRQIMTDGLDFEVFESLRGQIAELMISMPSGDVPKAGSL